MNEKPQDKPAFTLNPLEGPKIAGTYWVGGVGLGVGFNLTRRPAWLHRRAMRLVFGWEWRDAKGV